MIKTLDARAWSTVTALWACCAVCLLARAGDVPRVAVISPLDRGFSGFYNLDFAGAQKDFAAWQELHPDDPVGPVSEAAGFLFAEFNRLGVLEAQFYQSDAAFAGRQKQTPDPALRQHFMDAIGRAEIYLTLAWPKIPRIPTLCLPRLWRMACKPITQR